MSDVVNIKPGKVVLVGAGPGDPRLITVRGHEVLTHADVVVYDRLVASELLALAKNARFINVGKEREHHPVPQERINTILIEEAYRVGSTGVVVRLKGGDPFLFGRGGEEGSALAAAHIPFEIVPGVTSAFAASAYAGIPLTDRRYASSVHILTGHRRANGALNLPYKALVQVGGTLVFLMAVGTLAEICKGLMNAGMDPHVLAAVIERGTTSHQRRIDGTLATIAECATAAQVTSPALLVVGTVVTLASELDWFDALPLRDKTVLVTRPRDRAQGLFELLHSIGAKTLFFPCIATMRASDALLIEAINRLDQCSWLVLTSVFGVACLFYGLAAAGRDVRWLAHVKIAVIGQATFDALAEHGIVADLMPSTYDGVHLGSLLVETIMSEEDLSGSEHAPVMLFRSKDASRAVPDALTAAGIAYSEIAAYETKLAPEEVPSAISEAFAQDTIDLVTFTSASTVRGFCMAFPTLDCHSYTAVCLGEATSNAAYAAGFKVVTACEATIEALVEACSDTMARQGDDTVVH